MVYSRRWYRDRIVLNKDFKSRTKLDTVLLGTTMLLAAREFSVDGTFALDGRDVVLLADRFDGSHGTRQARALGDGTSGPKVTVICRQLAGINITSTGARGVVGHSVGGSYDE